MSAAAEIGGPAAFESFAAAVVEALDLQLDFAVLPTTDLYDEIGLDSLEAMELLLIVESWTGRRDRIEELPIVFTMGDAYEHYLAVSSSA